MLGKNSVNFRHALGSEVEGFDLLWRHANEDFEQTCIGLLFREGGQFITQVLKLLLIKPGHWSSTHQIAQGTACGKGKCSRVSGKASVH